MDALLRGEASPAAPVAVWAAAINRHLLPPQLQGELGFDARDCKFTYDVLVFDGDHRGVVCLHPDLVPLVDSGLLRPGAALSIASAPTLELSQEQYKRRFPVVRLLRFRAAALWVTGEQAADAAADSEWHPDAIRDDGKPTLLHSRHYLPALADELMDGNVPSWTKRRAVLHDARLSFKRLGALLTDAELSSQLEHGGEQPALKAPSRSKNAAKRAAADEAARAEDAAIRMHVLQPLAHADGELLAPATLHVGSSDVCTLRETLDDATLDGTREIKRAYGRKGLHANEGRDDGDDGGSDALASAAAAHADAYGDGAVAYDAETGAILAGRSSGGGGRLRAFSAIDEHEVKLLSRAYPALQRPLIGRLFRVGRLQNFGVPGTKQTLPFKFTFRLRDGSRYVDIVVWNGAAAQWHAALQALPLGSAVAVVGYRTKVLNNKIEVSLNAQGPAGHVLTVSEVDLQQYADLLESCGKFEDAADAFPMPELKFHSAYTLRSLADGTPCSIAGIISHVGPVCRQPGMEPDFDNRLGGRAQRMGLLLPRQPPAGNGSSSSSSSSAVDPDVRELAGACAELAASPAGGMLGPGPGRGQWHMYRWVRLRDGTRIGDVHVKLYAGCGLSQQQFDSLRADTPVILAHMRVVAPPRPPSVTTEGDPCMGYEFYPQEAIDAAAQDARVCTEALRNAEDATAVLREAYDIEAATPEELQEALDAEERVRSALFEALAAPAINRPLFLACTEVTSAAVGQAELEPEQQPRTLRVWAAESGLDANVLSWRHESLTAGEWFRRTLSGRSLVPIPLWRNSGGSLSRPASLAMYTALLLGVRPDGSYFFLGGSSESESGVPRPSLTVAQLRALVRAPPASVRALVAQAFPAVRVPFVGALASSPALQDAPAAATAAVASSAAAAASASASASAAAAAKPSSAAAILSMMAARRPALPATSSSSRGRGSGGVGSDAPPLAYRLEGSASDSSLVGVSDDGEDLGAGGSGSSDGADAPRSASALAMTGAALPLTLHQTLRCVVVGTVARVGVVAPSPAPPRTAAAGAAGSEEAAEDDDDEEEDADVDVSTHAIIKGFSRSRSISQPRRRRGGDASASGVHMGPRLLDHLVKVVKETARQRGKRARALRGGDDDEEQEGDGTASAGGAPRPLAIAASMPVRDAVLRLGEALDDADDDTGSPTAVLRHPHQELPAVEVEAGEPSDPPVDLPHSALWIELASVDGRATMPLLLNSSALLPQFPALRASVRAERAPAAAGAGGGGAGSGASSSAQAAQPAAAKRQRGEAPTGRLLWDADASHLRAFFPPAAPRGREELVRYICDPTRRFAFCVTVQQRPNDLCICPATGLMYSADALAGMDPEQRLAMLGRRPPTVRIEAIYELGPNGDSR